MTANPAAMTGLAGKTGSIAVGQSADLAAVNASGHLVGSVVGGQPTSVS
jgi:imidazolonepropionase-like amidohydrolase